MAVSGFNNRSVDHQGRLFSFPTKPNCFSTGSRTRFEQSRHEQEAYLIETNQSPKPAEHSISTFRLLILDHKRISHGAFRLWHYLRSRANKENKCWPTQRQISSDIGCKAHSLKDWISNLESAGYLHVEKVGQKHNNRYTILQGNPNGVALPEWATPRDAQKGSTEKFSRCPNSHAALPQTATPRDAQKGNLSNSQGVNTMSKGTAPLSKIDKISLERELKAIDRELAKRCDLKEYTKGSPTHTRIQTLTARQAVLREQLGVLA